MASRRILDAPGHPAIGRSIIRLLCFFLICATATLAQDYSDPELAKLKQLFKDGHWQEIAERPPAAGASSDAYFYYGSALARLQRWDEAHAAFESGVRLWPTDPRFSTELAGVKFKRGRYAEAQHWLERSLRLVPDDNYSNDFLATIFFLQGNRDAAIKYWNRAGKPKIDSVVYSPTPRTNPVLLDRALTFSPTTVLRLPVLLTSEARTRQLGIFATSNFQLAAQPGGDFNLVIENNERNGCGHNKWECLLLAFGLAPAQTLRFNYFNVGREAVNFHSRYRWDEQKRQIAVELDTPVAGQPKWHLQLGTDLRNENWGIRSTFGGAASLEAALNLKRESVHMDFTDVVSGKWSWSESTEISHRSYNNVLAGNVLTPQLLIGGAQLKQALSTELTLLRIPERRLTLESGAEAEVAKLWSGNTNNFAQFTGTIGLHWFPQHTGEKYELQHTIRLGKTVGDLPFDELFTLGVLGDTALLMRAHIATHEGQKGSAPLGRDYFLSNWDGMRSISPLSRFNVKVKVGPFVDTGKITDANAALGSHKWLWDTGIEAKIQVFGFGVALSYGRDLRAGHNAFVARTP
jgi:tetratricopeptide (TPR) repeat protein